MVLINRKIVLVGFIYLWIVKSIPFIGKLQKVKVTGELGCDNSVHDFDVYVELHEKDFC